MTRETKMLAALLGVSGVLHFVITKQYASIVPKPLPYKRELVYASGVAELGCAAMLTQPRTRRLGGLLSFGLLLAVFPANVQMTVDRGAEQARRRSGTRSARCFVFLSSSRR